MRILGYTMFLIGLYLTANGQVQKEGNVWAFGQQAGLDFNSGNPSPFLTAMVSDIACASVCDTNGMLLFYTDGSRVWNRYGILMVNGVNLTGNIYQPGVLGGSSTHQTRQGTLIVRNPSDYNKYYIFSITAPAAINFSWVARLYYSEVDMTLYGGLGDVITATKGTLLDTNVAGKMNAVQGDNCDVFVLVHLLLVAAGNYFTID